MAIRKSNAPLVLMFGLKDYESLRVGFLPKRGRIYFSALKLCAKLELEYLK